MVTLFLWRISVVMFNISFFELMVILVVGLIFIGPKELPLLVKNARKLLLYIKETKDSIKETLTEIDDVKSIKNELSDVNDSLKEIVDLDGNIQKVYDISDVMPEIRTARNTPSAETAKKDT